MRIIKLVCSFNILGKLQPYGLKNVYRMKLRNFSVGSCFSEKIMVQENNTVSFSGIEQLSKMSGVSKKHNKLSQIEEKDMKDLEKLKKGDFNYPYESTEERVKHILKDQLKVTINQAVKAVTAVEIGKVDETFFDRYSDVLIIGGGAVGLSIAFALRSRFPHGPVITVVDKDDSFPHASTNLSQGIVTQQLFTDEEEIAILKYGAEFFSTFSRDTEVCGKPEFKLPYDPLGSLILAEPSNVEEVLKRNEKMKLHGISNKILDPKTLRKKFPWLNTEGVIFGSLGMINEGMVDPWAYLLGLKCKAVNLGVNFVTAEVIDFGFDDEIRRVVCKLPDGTYNFIDFAYCVIAGGLESLNLVEVINNLSEFRLKLKLPLEERMRYEYYLHSFNGPGLNTPTVIDPDGTYFRRAGLTGHYVAGVPSVVDVEENDPYHVFSNKIKPFIMKRIPGLEKVDLIGGWIDAHDYCISNGVGITGPHPETDRIIFALGFSHLGLQYLPALSRAVMEFIIYDEYQTIDFTPFHLENLWRKQHLEAEKKKKELLESKARIALPS